MTHQITPSLAEQPASSFPIVAIGASAGGLKAVSELITNLSPTTGMAYIYIQHSDGPPGGGPDENDPLLVLSRATAMPVVMAKDQTPIQPNQVYIITPGISDEPTRDLEVIDGVLILMPRQQVGEVAADLPIDRFFIALANQQRDGAIAILLSGTALDGALGMRAIRASGGLTFAQDETAHFQSMPRSAIAEGVADRVLSPAEIARELEQLSQQSVAFRRSAGANAPENADAAPTLVDPTQWTGQSDHRATDEEFIDTDPATIDSVGTVEGSAVDSDGSSVAWEQATEEELQHIIQMVRQATGADFAHYKMATIRRRIVRRMLLLRLDTLPDYADYLHQHPDETQALYDDLLINVTTFFRDAETMNYLRKVILPQLVGNKAPRELLRIWIPACSTGQEAYSIAILLLEVLAERATSLTIQIFATDLSESAVTKARLGSYSRAEVMDVLPRRLQRFFTKVDDHYRINKTVRDLCVFAPHNLLKDPPFSRLDFVSCRNLLIYLDPQLQRKAIATFHYALNPSGYLLLGKSETVGSSSPFFSPVETTYRVYTRKNDIAGRSLFEMNSRSGLTRSRRTEEVQPRTDEDTPAQPFSDKAPPVQTTPEMIPVPRRPKPPRPANDLDKAVDNLLSQFVPPSVVVNAELDIFQFRGSTGLFLEPLPGRASLNLLKMARPALAFELRNIIHKAGQSGQPVRRSGLEIKVKDKFHYVAIQAVPFITDADERLFLVLFEEVTAIVTTDDDATDARSRRIRQLEGELTTLRDDMRTVIENQKAAHEELQSANEEIISSNEELQSINEELETSKEEIESSNEELMTINQELQVRNDQLSESYAFAEAIFDTISEATLVLTPDLRVKSANPRFYTLFGLSEAETEGRLIYELASRQWDIPQLRSLLTDVATRDVQVQGFELTYEFPGVGEKVLSLNARRVVRQQEAILLAIEDITEHRRSQRLLEEREAWFRQIADNAPALIWVAGPDGRYMFLNNVWQEYTGNSQAEVVANGWTQLLHAEDRAGYEHTYQTHLETQQPFHTEYRLRRHDGDYHWMLENAQPTFGSDGQFTGFIGTAADVQEQKKRNAELDGLVAQRTEELTETNARLELTNDQLQSVLNGVPAAITLMEAVLPNAGDPASVTPIDFTTSGFNQRAQELLGDAPDTIRAKSLLEINPEFRENGLFDSYVAVYKSGQSVYREVGFETGQGERCFAFYVTRQVDGQGVVVTALDITDRKQAEAEVRQAAKSLQAVLDNSPASISLLKAIRTPSGAIADFQVMVANQQFAQLVDQPLERVLLLRATQLGDQLWAEQTLNHLARVAETGEPFYVEQQNENSGWLAISVTKQDDSVVVMGLDITDLRQMQQQRKDLLDQIRQSGDTVSQLAILQEQARARGELLRTSSHDLRGSLGVIQGAADLLTFADSDEERAQMLDMLERNVKETTRLITELLDFSRLEAGQQQVEFAPFDAAELLHKLGENVRPLVGGKGLHLHLSGEEELPVEGDALNVFRIAQNLVLNALKYTARGSIRVGWGSTGPDEWFFSVEDTGPGMNQALVDQLSHGIAPDGAAAHNPADTFVEKPLLGPASGEGIGLVIVRKLCDLLRGRLLVESQPGRGSVFRVLLPRRY